MRRIPETTPVLRELELPPNFEIRGGVTDVSGHLWLAVAPHANHSANVPPLLAVDGRGRIVARAENGRLARAGLPVACVDAEGGGIAAIVSAHREAKFDDLFHWRIEPDGRIREETLLAETPSKISLGAFFPSVIRLPSALIVAFPSTIVVETNGAIRWRNPRTASFASGDLVVLRAGDRYKLARLSDGAPAGSVPASSNWIYGWSNRTALSVFTDEDSDSSDRFDPGSWNSRVTVHDVPTGRTVFTARGALTGWRADAPVICVTESTGTGAVERRFTPDGTVVAEIPGSRGHILELDDRFLVRQLESELVCETIVAPVERVWRVAIPPSTLRFHAFASGGAVVVARHLQPSFVLVPETGLRPD